MEVVTAEKVGAELRKIRKDVGLKQDELADILNWNVSKISRIENGVQEITYIEHLEYMEALKPSSKTLFIPDYRKGALV